VSNRRMRGSWTSTIPSRFVDELPEPHIEVAESKGFDGFTGYGNVGGSRFDQAETFGSSYGTPGWQRARSRRGNFGSGGNSGSGGDAGGFRDTGASYGAKAAPGPTPRARGPLTIEGELVAKSTGTASVFAVGDRVFHQKFGNGNVRHVEGNKLTIYFDRAGEKKVVDSFIARV
jgi:DNA helicase II / ATP-dependent DNA helicase PcrA